MLVVGLDVGMFHDASACAIVDGELVFATEEERYTRYKHAVRQPPFNSLVRTFRFMKGMGLRPGDVDAFAANWNLRLVFGWLAERSQYVSRFGRLYDVYTKHRLMPSYVEFGTGLLRGDLHFLIRRLIRGAAREVGEDLDDRDIRLVPVRHHLAHAASAYYFSGFSSSSILVLDGAGEREGTTIWRVRNGEFEELSRIGIEEGSLGFLWEKISNRLGYDFLEGPGKLMGLAPYGGGYAGFLERLRSMVRLSSGGKPYTFVAPPAEVAEHVVDGVVKWDPRREVHSVAASVARALQEFTNEIFVHLGRWIRDATSEDRIALAGGVALNARANMELHYSKIFNDMFIFPAANDAGTSIGAAAYVYEHVLGGRMKHGRLRNVYLGAEYSDEDIKSAVEASKFRAKYVGDDVNEVADLIARGNVLTWYQGRSELGPRALGNRSILADPRDKEMWKRLNAIKGREFWRPLAPSLLEEDKGEYFVDPVAHEFMILMFRFRDGMAGRVPAVYHVDGTARPQTVTRDMNPTYYDVIKAFKDMTGEGIVVNTSFNLAGEPLVETPRDAIRSFAAGGFDAMYMQGYLIYKR
ncbi:MAG: carbamoyltransferase C-terminal domain-containing protein [Nitrososphaeria archaeon]